MIKRMFLFSSLSILLFTSAHAKEKYALLIGINDYQSPRISDLHYSEADATYLKEALIKYARFKPRNVKLLLGSAATQLKIKEDIFWLGKVAKEEDEVFFYFSGHGTRVPDVDGNEEDGMDEAFCPYGTELDNPASVIMDDDIGHWFRRIKAQEIIVVLDCCHSGGASGKSLNNAGSKGINMATGSSNKYINKNENNPYAQDLETENKFIITASTADELSFENVELGHGVFTYYIVEALKGKADSNDDKKITTYETYVYTKEKTIEFVRKIHQKQTPLEFGTLKNAVIAEVNNQMCDLIAYHKDLGIVLLEVGSDASKTGDIFLVKKNMLANARGFDITSIADENIFKVQILQAGKKISKAKIIESYYNPDIEGSQCKNYYAIKVGLGDIYIHTVPWSTAYLDGKKIGMTDLKISNVPAGEHELKFQISIKGYPNYVTKKIVIKENKPLRIVEKFKRK